MFTKTLATALVSGLLLTGAMGGSSFADGCGGGGGGGDGSFTETHTLHFKMPKKQNRPWASSTDRRTGHTTTSRGASDGSRHITVTDRNGNVIHTDRMNPRKKAVDKKNKKAKKPGRPWASAYDPATGTRTTSVGNGDGSRTVIRFGPFGIGIGISR